MNTTELLQSLNKDLALGLPDKISAESLQLLLAQHVNYLIKNDFEKLVGFLYRIDVQEQKLKLLLKQYAGEDAGNIIAALIIERQQEKIRSRKHFRQQDNEFDEEEKW